MHSAVVGLETLPDDNLLVLERRFIAVDRPLVVILRRLDLSEDPATPASATELARFDTSRGWAIDNFEGVASHQGANYFLISDDNASALQETVLLYFELLPPDQRDSNPEHTPAPLANHHL